MDQSPFTADAPAETHLRLREGSEEVIRVLSVHVPLLEALPEYRGRGIGSELVRRMLEKLDDLYMVDLLYDSELQRFYASPGMRPATGMMVRRYTNQSGTNLGGAIY